MSYRVNREATKNYHDQYNEPCNCLYCENFRQAIREVDEVCEVLEHFGLNENSPLEIMSFELDASELLWDYQVYFSVAGELAEEELLIYDDLATMTLFQRESQRLLYNHTGMEEPYFILELKIELPWLLFEYPEEC